MPLSLDALSARSLAKAVKCRIPAAGKNTLGTLVFFTHYGVGNPQDLVSGRTPSLVNR